MKYLWSPVSIYVKMRILWSRNRETSHVVCATECQLDTHKRLLKGENSVRSCAGHCWSYVQAKIQCVEAMYTVLYHLINWVLNKVLSVMSVMSLPFAKCSPLEPQNLAPMPLVSKVQLQATTSPCYFTACVYHSCIHSWLKTQPCALQLQARAT